MPWIDTAFSISPCVTVTCITHLHRSFRVSSKAAKNSATCAISGFYRKVGENCALLGCYAASSGYLLFVLILFLSVLRKPRTRILIRNNNNLNICNYIYLYHFYTTFQINCTAVIFTSHGPVIYRCDIHITRTGYTTLWYSHHTDRLYTAVIFISHGPVI